MNIVDTKDLQQQVLDDFAFHLGYDRDHSTGNYKRDLFHTCHSPFRRFNYNTMVTIYNSIAICHRLHLKQDPLIKLINGLFDGPHSRMIAKAIKCPTPIETIYLQRAKKQNKILCHKHQIKFTQCEDGQLMKEDFEEKYYAE
jgi:hypothetical protein